LPDLQNNNRLLGTSPPELMKSVANLSDVLLKAGILKKPANLAGLVHAEYLPRKPI